jgi:hypothetical protein
MGPGQAPAFERQKAGGLMAVIGVRDFFLN